jgi:hypothetical protein
MRFIAVALVVMLALGVVAVLLLERPESDPTVVPESTSVFSPVPGHDAPWTMDSLADVRGDEDPARAGWDSEVANGRIGEQLAALREGLEGAFDRTLIADLAAPNVTSTPLRPAVLDASTVGAVTVQRPESDGWTATTEHAGVDGLTEALATFLAPFAGTAPHRVEFKVIGVEVAEAAWDARLIVRTTGAGGGRRVEQHARWDTTWSKDERPRLQRIAALAYEASSGPAGEESLFADTTQSVLGANQCFVDQLVPGIDTWCRRLDKLLGMAFRGHQGLAIGDVNGDGLDDLYVCQPGGLPNRLFVQRADGTAEDVSVASGVGYLDLTRSALLVDLDNDGDQDLMIAGETVAALVNDGAGSFTPAWAIDRSDVYSLCATDYDDDGDLDVYACRYSAVEESAPAPYHDANNGSPNILFRNQSADGRLLFDDATVEAGLDENNRRFSFAAAWADYDDDGDQDLYVANDFGRNNLYRNDAGRFADVAAASGVEDLSAGMSVAWGDYDNDGREDLHVSNMFSAAGNRIAYQRRFKSDADDRTRGAFQRHARGNSLFRNLGSGAFEDVSVDAGITVAGWAWASLFADVNNDGLQDVLTLNGFVSNEDTDDL